MRSEIFNPKFRQFVFQILLFIGLTLGIVVFVNYFVDSSQVNTTKSYREMARLVLAGNTVAVPENYNERAFQVSVVEEMNSLPETIVIGSSRGMYLGEKVTSYQRIYNNCVSGACMEDYYALLGLYQQKFSSLPKRVIIEISPWVFYENNPENRWLENDKYLASCKSFYYLVNGVELQEKPEEIEKGKEKANLKKENPYFSIPYFQYNISILRKKGIKAFVVEKARISTDDSEAADLPDGTIRYVAASEKANPERLKKVKETKEGVTYENVHKMSSLGKKQKKEFESILTHLQEKDIEVIIFISPFSETQCKYIFEKNSNPVFREVDNYLIETGKTYDIKIKGSCNAGKFNLTDNYFIDFMHLDKAGTKIVWETK